MSVGIASNGVQHEVNFQNLNVLDKERMVDILQNKVMFFTGYPGSGKGTQGKRLSELLNIRHLSTGELFRAEAAKGSEIGKKMAFYMLKGEVIPKELTFAYLRNELSKPEYRQGFILDGYPKNLESHENLMETLRELQMEPLAAIHFEITRDLILDRLTGRLHCNECEHDFHVKLLPPKKNNMCDDCSGPLEARDDDSKESILKRLDVFEKNTRPVIERFQQNQILFKLDASKRPEQVQSDIVDLILNLGKKQILEGGSYFLRIPKEQENSSVFHNHIDAKNHYFLRAIVKKVEQLSKDFQNKIYPVQALQLGPQLQKTEFEDVYQALPNFHSINQADDEAFSTGKMGDAGFNYEQIQATLEACFSYPGQRVMTELEEDIYAQVVDETGRVQVTLDRGNTAYVIDWNKLPGWKEGQISHVPKFELHHGFDLPKKPHDNGPPIDLKLLSQKTTALGFQTGGWFIFRNPRHWAYRSNEFSNKSYDEALALLQSQAKTLHETVSEFMPGLSLINSSSLEKVHAMWRVK